MKGVSEVIAIILILMITIAIAGLAYTFMSSTMASTTSAASSAVTTTTSSMLTSFTIESIDFPKVYIRNMGQNALSSLSVYVNDAAADFDITPSTISYGQVGAITIYDLISKDDIIKIVSPNGFSAAKNAPDPCDKTVLCYKFDEGSGTTVYDSSPYGNDASISGASWTSGISNGALSFDGVNDRVSTSADLRFQTSHGPSTLELSFKPNAVQTKVIFSDNCIEWGLLTNTTGLYGRVYWEVGGVELTANEWYHVALVHDHPTGLTNTVIKLYVNGVLRGQTTGTITQNGYRDVPYWIGEDGCASNTFFNGTIDEVRIYNRAIY